MTGIRAAPRIKALRSDEGGDMKLGDLKLSTMLRFWAVGSLVFMTWGIAIVLLFQWLSPQWASENKRRLEEAELRPDHAHFRPIDGPPPPSARAGVTYVPVYSTLYLGDRELQAGLAVTLSLRNTSPAHELVVHRVGYYDTAGALTLRLADRPHAIPPMATAEFFIDRKDPVGGPGANYLVEWSIPEGGSDPLIEAVMVGRFGNAGITLVGRGMAVGTSDAGTPSGSPGR
jgi:hypothetical protein